MGAGDGGTNLTNLENNIVQFTKPITSKNIKLKVLEIHYNTEYKAIIKKRHFVNWLRR